MSVGSDWPLSRFVTTREICEMTFREPLVSNVVVTFRESS